MAFTLAYLTSPVPAIPERNGPTQGRRETREHFGTEAAALRRARELLPFNHWTDLRLYGPDGRLIADQAATAGRLGADNPAPTAALQIETEREIPP